MIKYYVEFLYPGALFSESDTREIKSRDEKVKLPKGAYAYTIFEREEMKMDGETLTGKPKNRSHRFIRGEKWTKERVIRELPDSQILQSNMKCNGWNHVIKCAQGMISPQEGDVLI